MKKQLQKGFTLIELMIVVAIIGILASIALPAYQTYVAKSNITSIVASAAAGKTAMWTSYVDNGSMPAAGTDPGQMSEPGSDLIGFNTIMTTAGKLPGNAAATYTRDSGTSASFAISIAGINGNLTGKSLTLTYSDTSGALEFTCVATTGTPVKYLPKNCTAAAS